MPGQLKRPGNVTNAVNLSNHPRSHNITSKIYCGACGALTKIRWGGREGPGWVGGVEKERQEEGKREGDVKSPRLSHFHPESCHHRSITHSIFLLITDLALIALFPFHFPPRSSSFCPLPPVYYPPSPPRRLTSPSTGFSFLSSPPAEV